jgi:hypothetical protein
MDEFNRLLSAADTDVELDRISRHIERAYRDACDRFDSQIGCDNRTFGMEVYSFAWFRIEESQLFKVTANEPKWLTLGDFDVAMHRVPFGPIGNAFPRERGGWPSNACGELDFERQDGVTGKKMLVIAHMGSQQDGFQAAYLCLPTIVNGELVGWARTHLVWAKRPPVEIPSMAPPEVGPKEENKEKAKVARRRKKRDGGGAPNDAQ